MSEGRGEEFRDDTRAAHGGAGARRRALLTAAELAPFTALDDRRAALAVAQTWGLIAVLATLGTVFWGQPVPVALAAVLMASQQHALFVLAHDAAHYRLFTNRRLNDWVGRACGTLGGVSMCTYRVTHRLHHNHLYGRQDPDAALNGGYPRGA
ncbi:MAG: fatty acid desaturase, partial [Burkholderiales bacterium]